MKKKSVASVILRTFFKALGIMALLIAVGFAGYFATMLFYNITSRSERSTQYSHVIDVTTGSDSRNLIYSYDEKSMLIDRIVLEIYHSDTNNMDYVTIPSGTNVEVSGDTYTEMMKASQEVPQIVRLSRLNKYFSGDVAYEYGIMALEEAMGTDIGYFTAMTSAKFNEFFENRGTKEEPFYAPSQNILAEAAKCSDSYDLTSMIEDYWDDVICDITCSQKTQYSEGFKKIKAEMIHTYRVTADKVKNTYTIDKDKTKTLLRKLDTNEEYTVAEDKRDTSDTTAASSTAADSKKQSILLSNASQINGLAASYKEKLEAAGYTIYNTGNYPGEVQATSLILVKKKGQGKDLLSYFKSAKIQVTSKLSDDNADIEVVIGSKDRITGY